MFPEQSVIVGEAVAGESAKTRAMLESIIKNIDKQTLDAAELLEKVQSQGLYNPDFNTYKEYTRSIGLKDSKAEYLPKIVRVMKSVGFERKDYDKLSISRLRHISSLDPEKTWKNPETGEEVPFKDFIVNFVQKGEEIDMETLLQHIRTLKGFVGENDITWLNLPFARITMDNTVRPAIEKMKALIGSVAKDEDGMSKDASDSRCVEMITVHFLNDETVTAEQLSAPQGEPQPEE